MVEAERLSAKLPPTMNAPHIGLVWPRYGGHLWLKKAPAAATLVEEKLAREGLTIQGMARPPRPPRKPACPYEKGSYLWFKWVEDRDQLDAVREVTEENRRRGRIGGRLCQ